MLPQGFGRPQLYVDMLQRGFDELRREGARRHPKMMSLGIACAVHGPAEPHLRAARVHRARQEAGDVWIAPREEIARWWIDHHEDWAV